MKRPFFLFLPFLLFVAGAFVACEEVEEAGKYDNWVPRNEAFIDSIKAETGNSIVASLEDAKNMEIGKLYAIKVETGGVSVDGNSKPPICLLQEAMERRWRSIPAIYRRGKHLLLRYFHHRGGI